MNEEKASLFIGKDKAKPGKRKRQKGRVNAKRFMILLNFFEPFDFN